LSVMRSLGGRANSVQLRVGDPVLVAVCQGGHAPRIAIEPALKPVS
jgi:hypothetical protein